MKDEKDEKNLERSNHKNKIIIVILLLIILILSILLIFESLNKKEKVPENNPINDNENVKEEKDEYVTRSVHDKYLVKYKDNQNGKIYSKIMDMNNNLLYEGETGELILGVDNNLYSVVRDKYHAYVVKVSIFENNEFRDILVDVNKENEDDIYNGYTMVVYEDNYFVYDEDPQSNHYLVGFSRVDDENNEHYFYDIRKNRILELDDKYIRGMFITLVVGDPIDNFSKDYLVLSTNVIGDGKFGLYSIKEEKVVLDFDYDGLYPDSNGNLVAIKNNKAGVIDLKGNVIVDYDYDFMDRNDGFMVVSKNKKMAIMNNEYKLITDFVFDYNDLLENGKVVPYDYMLCCANRNSFRAEKTKDGYILYNGINDEQKYKINFDGKYTLIK